MKKLLLILISMAIVSGCVTTHEFKRGRSTAHIGEIRVEKALTLVGGSVNDTLILYADENENALIAAGKGASDFIPCYLPSAARAEYTSQLKKLFEWGKISAKEKIETSKHVGFRKHKKS